MKQVLCVLALLSAVMAPPMTARAQDGVLLEGFERGIFVGWRVSGDAWGNAPADSRHGGARFHGWSGNYYLSSAHPRTGDYRLVTGTGELLSPAFRITHTELRFKIGGGNYPGLCGMNLLVRDADGSERVVRSQTGGNTDTLEEASWDVSDLVGKSARLQIVDKLSVGSQAYVMIDDIALVGEVAPPAPAAPAAEPTPSPEPEPVAPVRTGPVMTIEGKLPRPRALATPPSVGSGRDTVSLPDGRVLTGRALVLEATGYGPGENGPWGDRTALGTKVGLGTVAVDPRVIPLRTRLWVEGYGECVALDTGGAIKGLRIDLGFNDDVTANQYGRKKVKVLILD